MNLTSGKLRGLQELSTKKGFFNILAIDHRDVYIEMLQLGQDKKVKKQQVIESKMDIIKELSPLSSGILMDPIYSAHQSIRNNIIPKDVGIMVSIEGNDYNTQEFNFESYLMEDISVKTIKNMGASCVKLFLYYNPLSEIAVKQEELVAKIADDCKNHDIVFLLEPILYPIESKELSVNQKLELTYEMLKKFKNKAIDIFKIEFPGDIKKLNDKENLNISKKVSSIINVPWIILSSGVEFNLLKKQIKIACDGGASGIAVGRTLWGDYVLDSSDINAKKMKSRMSEIFEIINKHGKDWKNIE